MITGNTQRNENVVHTTISKTPLPKFEITKFNGEQDNWESFKQIFESMIINDDSIPKVKKLHCLLLSLTGNTQKLLSGTKIEEANFDLAWKKLLRRYDNAEIRIHTYLEKLINLELINKKSAFELGNLLDTAEECFKNFKI